jgi:hypothetical protein
MPKNKDARLLSAECDEHLKALDRRRTKLSEDQRRQEMRELREVLRDELDGCRVPDWQVQQHAMF